MSSSSRTNTTTGGTPKWDLPRRALARVPSTRRIKLKAEDLEEIVEHSFGNSDTNSTEEFSSLLSKSAEEVLNSITRQAQQSNVQLRIAEKIVEELGACPGGMLNATWELVKQAKLRRQQAKELKSRGPVPDEGFYDFCSSLPADRRNVFTALTVGSRWVGNVTFGGSSMKYDLEILSREGETLTAIHNLEEDKFSWGSVATITLSDTARVHITDDETRFIASLSEGRVLSGTLEQHAGSKALVGQIGTFTLRKEMKPGKEAVAQAVLLVGMVAKSLARVKDGVRLWYAFLEQDSELQGRVHEGGFEYILRAADWSLTKEQLASLKVDAAIGDLGWVFMDLLRWWLTRFGDERLPWGDTEPTAPPLEDALTEANLSGFEFQSLLNEYMEALYGVMKLNADSFLDHLCKLPARGSAPGHAPAVIRAIFNMLSTDGVMQQDQLPLAARYLGYDLPTSVTHATAKHYPAALDFPSFMSWWDALVNKTDHFALVPTDS